MIPQSCDTMVTLGSTALQGQTIFAKNSDRPSDECQPLVQHPKKSHSEGTVTSCQFVSLPEAQTTFRHIGSRPYWCWGYEHGFNEHQVVIGNEGLASKLPVSSTPKLIGMEILRLGLERATTASEAVDVMTDAITQHGQGKFDNDANVRTYDNGYIVSDPTEAFVIETAGHHWAVKPVDGNIGISNVYSVENDWARLSPTAESYAVQQGWWSSSANRFNFADAYTGGSRTEGSGAMRRIRSCKVLENHAGKIDVGTMMALLSDHGSGQDPGEPFKTDPDPGAGICVHAPEEGSGGNTAASLVAHLCSDESRLPVYWCSFYSPCLGLFLPTFIEGNLPTVLANGGGESDPESPWWGFHRLACLVRFRPERVSTVRSRWVPLQTQLFQSAEEIAVEGHNLLNNGHTEKASLVLTEYMNQNVRTMLATLSELLDEFSAQEGTTGVSDQMLGVAS